jgi:transcriptional regulator with XRE-family HTH domain
VAGRKSYRWDRNMAREGWPVAETVGAKVARLRRRRGLTQQQLAELLCAATGSAAVSGSEISRWERGVRQPGPAWLAWLGQILGTPLTSTSPASTSSASALPAASAARAGTSLISASPASAWPASLLPVSAGRPVRRLRLDRADVPLAVGQVSRARLMAIFPGRLGPRHAGQTAID